MKIFKKSLSVICVITCILSTGSAGAHSGRLDSNGGHHKRSDGTYHYHYGSDRTIEYPSKPTSTSTKVKISKSSSSTSNKSTSSVKAKQPAIYGTALKTYIRGKQIPTYYYDGKNPCEVIIAEDLASYGYDIKWVEQWNTLYVSRNNDKDVTGVYVPYTYSGEYIEDAYNSNTAVRLTFSNGESYLPPSYSLNGRMIIPVDEMKCLGNFRYSAAENAVYID